MALSSTKEMYTITSLVSCEAIWLHKMLTRLFGLELDPTIIHHDN